MSLVSAPLTPSEVVLEQEKSKRIQKWVLQTQFHEPANPFTPATPPVTLSRTLPLPITTFKPLFTMTHTSYPGPMAPPAVFDPRTGAYRTNAGYPTTAGYIQPTVLTGSVVLPPVPIQPTIPNPAADIANIMPPSAPSHRAPVQTTRSARVQTQPRYTRPFIPPRSSGRSRSRDRDHHNHHHHHSRSRSQGRARSYSPVGRLHEHGYRRDDVNPPIPPDYLPASPGPDHRSHDLRARARTSSGRGNGVASGTVHGDGDRDRHHEDRGYGHEHDARRVHSHDYAHDLPSAFRRLSIGEGRPSGYTSIPRPAFSRHRSRSIDDRDLQTSRARYYQHQHQQQQPLYMPYPPQPQPQQYYQQPGGPKFNYIPPTSTSNQPTVVPMTMYDGRSGWMVVPPSGKKLRVVDPNQSIPYPTQPRSAGGQPSPSFFSRLFSGFGRKHSGSPTTPIQPSAAPVQYVQRYMPHHHRHGDNERKLRKKRRESY